MRTSILVALLALMLTPGAACGQKKLFRSSGDVGDVKMPGNVRYDSGVYTLTAAGANMWDRRDAFFMTWRRVSGDFTVSTNIAFEGAGVNAHRKLGVIVRDGLAPDAVYAGGAVHADGLTSLQYRPAKGGVTLEAVAQPTGGAIPHRITLERRGDTLSLRMEGSEPAEPSARITMDLPRECLVGLFMCSHEDVIMETGYFSGVTLIER